MEGIPKSNVIEDYEIDATQKQESVAHITHAENILRKLSIEPDSIEAQYLDANILNFLTEKEEEELVKKLETGNEKLSTTLLEYVEKITPLPNTQIQEKINLSKKTVEDVRAELFESNLQNRDNKELIKSGKKNIKVNKSELDSFVQVKKNMLLQIENGFLDIGQDTFEEVAVYLQNNPKTLKHLLVFIENKNKAEANKIIDEIMDNLFEFSKD